MWSEQGGGPQQVTSGHPGAPNNAAEAMLAYDVAHHAPWDFRVSLYTWTKGIASGAYLVPALLLLAGLIEPGSGLWQWAAPVLGGAFLAATAGLLILDLTHPERFYLVLTRPQWRSWLARGGVILSLYGCVLVLHFLAALVGRTGLPQMLAWAGLPLAVLSAIYTAWLFAQAKARDLWQSPLLPPQLLVQALASGAAALLVAAASVEPAAVRPLAQLTTLATLVHLLLVAGEATITHPTAHARLAAFEMTHGRYGRYFRAGVALQAAGVLLGFVLPQSVLQAPLVLAGLLAYEHAFVQGGQAVALA
jgi:formate-dependent nitrite reductase membrane component NrfD